MLTLRKWGKNVIKLCRPTEMCDASIWSRKGRKMHTWFALSRCCVHHECRHFCNCLPRLLIPKPTTGIVQQPPKECLPRRSLHRMNVYSKVHGPIMMEPPRGTSGLRRSSNKRCILMRHYLRKAAAFASCHVLTNVALWRSKHAVWLLFLNLVLRCGKSQRDLRQLCFMA